MYTYMHDNLPGGTFQVFHIPSHLDPCLTTGPYEDWISRCNGHANNQRQVKFMNVHAAAVQYHNAMLKKQRALRQIYFRIAEITRQPQTVTDAVETLEAEPTLPAIAWRPKLVDLELHLPVTWAQQISRGSSLPTDFVHELCSFLWNQHAATELAAQVSWLELVFVVDIRLGYRFSCF